MIVPSYNHELYVEEALDSVRDEGYPTFEIVVIDDGSNDESASVVERWAAANPSVELRFSRQRNAGTSTTANRLLAQARGEYVVPLASDDRLLPGGIEVRVAYLEANQDLVAIFGDCRVIDGSGAVVRERGVASGDPGARRRLLADPAFEIVNDWAVPGPVILYRRKAVLEMGGYREGLLAEDWDFYLRLAARKKVAFLDHVVSEYRWHGKNAGARPEVALRIAEDLRTTALRASRIFHGKLRLLLVHEAASWAARSASLRNRKLESAGWRLTAIALKLVAMAFPRFVPTTALRRGGGAKAEATPGRPSTLHR